MAMRTIAARGAIPHSHPDEVSNWLSVVSARLRTAWAARREAPREIVAELTTRDFVQADIAAFAVVASGEIKPGRRRTGARELFKETRPPAEDLFDSPNRQKSCKVKLLSLASMSLEYRYPPEFCREANCAG
jgi:hypothetical protein